MPNSYRINQINENINECKNPFNTPIENITIEAVRKIATYCELTENCKDCKIRILIGCSGKLKTMPSPFNWLDYKIEKPGRR